MCPKHWDLCDQAAVFKEPVLGGNNNKYTKSFQRRTVDAEKIGCDYLQSFLVNLL